MSDRCTSCGGPRNHFVDGKLRPKCAACNDNPGRAKTGPSLYRSSKDPTPALTPAATALVRQIDELLEDEAYEWAMMTLSGIRDTVSRTGRATEGQQRAVDNIENSRLRGR